MASISRLNFSGPPLRDTMVEPTGNARADYVRKPWFLWFNNVFAVLGVSVLVGASSALSGQHASVVASPFETSRPLVDGFYRVTYALRISQAASLTSSATVTIGWTTGGIACSQAFPAVTGNATNDVQGNVVPMRVDANTSVTCSVAYASTGGTPMKFDFDAVLEVLS